MAVAAGVAGVAGVTLVETNNTELPTALVAATLKVSTVPLVRPLTVPARGPSHSLWHVVAGDIEHEIGRVARCGHIGGR